MDDNALNLTVETQKHQEDNHSDISIVLLLITNTGCNFVMASPCIDVASQLT